MVPYDISVICCYTKIDQLNDLKESLRDQRVSVELVALDNRSARWKSAAAAYNHGARVATAPVLLFAHQDIVFLNSRFLTEFTDLVSQDRNLVVGVAGAVCSPAGFGRDLLSAMYQGSAKSRHSTISEARPAFTLDECLFGCHRDVLSMLRFDEVVCDGWHFYAVDFSLQAQLANIKVEVVPADVIHLSGGRRDESYYLAQEKIKAKYQDRFEVIPTTCGWTRTSDIDPYRPIIEDELAALRNNGIPYTLNFYHDVEDSLSLESEDFFPPPSFIDSAKKVLCDKADRPLIDLIKKASIDDGMLGSLISLNNMLKAQRWLLRDLLALYENALASIAEEFESSLSYRCGVKVLPWSKVDPTAIKASFDERRKAQEDQGSLSLSSNFSIEGLIDVLKSDPLSFRVALRSWGERVLEKRAPARDTALDVLQRKTLARLCLDPDSCLEELVEMQSAWNELEWGMDALRSAYEGSAAYRLGRFLGRLKKALWRGGMQS